MRRFAREWRAMARPLPDIPGWNEAGDSELIYFMPKIVCNATADFQILFG